MGRFGRGWSGRADEGPPDPAVVALVAAVLPMLDPPERWAVYTVPGPRDLPGPDEPLGRRERWWREHVSAVGGALLLVDPEVDHEVVRRAVDTLIVCAIAREHGVDDSVDIARAWRRRLPPRVDRPGGAPRPAPSSATAMEVVLAVVHLVDGS